MKLRLMRWMLPALLVCAAMPAQKREAYNGPRPPKPDIPYLLHAENLIATEPGEAREEKRKDETIYVVKGSASPVRTPLAEPIFLLQAEKLLPEKMELYRLQVKSGNREIAFPDNPKKRSRIRPVHTIITKLDTNLYRIEANEGVENGEYSLTPAGSNQVFCFQVY